MGFMILTCGLGLWAAAVIHLVAQLPEATLFLSSGSAVAAGRRHEAVPPAAPPASRALANITAAVAVPAAAWSRQ